MGLLEDCSEILEKLEVVKNEIQKTRKRIRDVTYVPEKGCFLCKEGGGVHLPINNHHRVPKDNN